MDLTYRLSVRSDGPPAAGPHLDVGIEATARRPDPVFEAELSLARIELTPAHALASLARRPVATMDVSAAIHRQAVALWGKGWRSTTTPDPTSPCRRDGLAALGARTGHPLPGAGGPVPPRQRHDGGPRAGPARTALRDGPARRLRSPRPRTPSVQVHDPRLAYRAVLGGSASGWARPSADGWWDVDDLTGFLRLLSRTVRRYDPVRNALVRRAARRGRPGRIRRPEDPARDRANIGAHYDLGNDFFSLLLDPTMTYSAAVFARPDATLAEASTEKLDRMCRLLELAPGDEVAEIGTGWGSFATHAADRYGARVTTTTISAEQYEWARKRVAAEGLADRVEVRNDDYRDLRGTFDKLASIEMIEAVDWRELDTFFATCTGLLAPDGADGPAGHRDAGRPLGASREQPRLHQDPHLPRRLPAVDRVDQPVDQPGQRPDPGRAARLRPALRRDPSPAGGPTWPSTGRSCPPSASTTGSPGCGSSTSPTARPVSTSASIGVVQCLLARPGYRPPVPFAG